MSCTFNSCPGEKPTDDPILTDIFKGKNARFYRYQTNLLHYDRVKDRQNAVEECYKGEATCPLGADQAEPIDQRLSVQPTYNEQGQETNSMLTVPERNRHDYAAFYPEGQIKAASDRVEFLQTKQRHPRQCNLYGNLCGDTSIVGAPAMPTGTELTAAQADRVGRGFNAQFRK